MKWLPWIISTLVLAGSTGAEEWSRFRGPNGSGVSSTKLPVQWTAKDYLWSIRLPGRGHSSPVVWKDRVFVTCGDEDSGKRFIFCIDSATGKAVWRKELEGEKSRKHRDNSFASSTPTVDADYLYTYWGGASRCTVMAFTHEGKKVWEYELGGFRSGHGFGPSLIVHKDHLIVPHDQGGNGSLVALDRRSGKVRWKVPRKGKASWSTPCVYQPEDGLAQLIFTNYEHGVTAIDPESGKVLWEMDVFYKKHVESAIASPIVAEDLVLATCGWMGVNQEVIALRPSGNKKAEKAKQVYAIRRSAPLCITPLVKGDLLFLWSDRGIVTCADLRTGKVHWRERARGSWYSSPVCADEAIYNISRTGEMVVLAAEKEHRVLGRNPFPEGSHSTPAIAQGRMYVQTYSHLIAIGKK